MIKFNDILLESKRVTLPERTLEVLKNAVNLIFKKRKNGFNKRTAITSLPIVIEDGTKGKVKIYVDPELPYYGMLDSEPEDSVDPKDFIILINPHKIKGKKGLYQTLYHEIMHATDPNFSVVQNEKFWSEYDTGTDESYYGHPVEFRAYTNEFLEGLVNEFKKRRFRMKNPKTIEQLKNSLNNILNHFSKNESLSPFSESLIQTVYGDTELEIGLRRTLDNLSKNFPEILDFRSEKYSKINYLEVLNLVKKHNPKDWNKFLTSLFLTYQEIEDFL